MTCQSCGAQVKEDALVCGQCGLQVAQSASTETVSNVHMEQASTTETVAQRNETIDKVTNTSKHYLNYVLLQLKHPTKNGLSTDTSQPLFGLITSILTALFFGLSLYTLLGVGGNSFFQLGFTDLFFPGLFYMVMLLAVAMGALFLGVKIQLDEKATLTQVFARFTHMLPLTLALFVLATIVGLIGLATLFNFLTMLAFLSIIFLTGYVYYSFHGNQVKKEPYFGLIGVYAVILVFIGLSFEWILASLMNSFFF
ncbi:hypothetical protein JOC54_003144 [Alkalihalobacillus xiaoxiensis]|uniref:Zinc ribbon domain-containing protein n=1 Tax=Shouchella xiaoxiensis TaxID=766895 RepID=A0ABS2SWJ1_9BACI|nr:zinc ribbon domain-containing protein [Shouchella xiaoxiensis]MBM7839864.1 hypothetical protein [Shouchella xiaoxiensis]